MPYTYEDVDKYLWERADTSQRAQWQPKIPEIVNLLNTGKMYSLAEAQQWNNLSRFQDRQTQAEVNLASMASSLGSIQKTTPITQDIINQNMAGLANLSPEDMAYVKSGLEKKFLTGTQPTQIPLGPNAYGGAAGFAAANPTAPPINPIAGTQAVLTSVPEKNAPENSIAGIQSVFGQAWQPSPAFTPALQSQGIFGAVRVGSSPNVFTLGPGGGWETAESFQRKFGTSDQTGIVGNITQEQATKLGINPASITAAPSTNPNITSESLQGETPIVIPPSGNKTDEAGVAAASVAATAKGIQDYITLLTPPKDEALDKLIADYSADLGASGGRGAAQLAAEEAQGVQVKKDALLAVQGRINTLQAEFNAYSIDQEGKPITMQSIQGSIAQKRNTIAAEMTMLQAQALVLQGQYDSAVAAANRSVDLKYLDITDHINTQAKLIEILQGQLTKTEQIRADAIKLYLQDQQDKLAVRVANEKDINATILNLMQSYPDAGWTGMPKTVAEATAKIQNSKIYQESVRPPQYATARATGGETTTGEEPITKFTDTQLNKGAATANIPITDFKSLDADTKNFFINNSSEIDDFKKNVDLAKENNEDPTEIEKMVTESQLPDAVKDTMTRYLWSKFERPTQNQSGLIKKGIETIKAWWNKIF